MAVLAAAFAAYAFDCGATTTPEEAMQCCDTMPCPPHSHEHSQDCCAPFVQPSPTQGIPFSFVFFAVLPDAPASERLDFSARIVAAYCHAPPLLQAAVLSPLRI